MYATNDVLLRTLRAAHPFVNYSLKWLLFIKCPDLRRQTDKKKGSQRKVLLHNRSHFSPARCAHKNISESPAILVYHSPKSFHVRLEIRPIEYNLVRIGS